MRRFGGETQAGLNVRCMQTVHVLHEAAELAEREGCPELWVLGDLFDTVRPEPQVIAAVMAALEPKDITLAPHARRVRLLMGNHEMVNREYGDHALGPMQALEWVQLHDGLPGWTEYDSPGGMRGEVHATPGAIMAVPFVPGQPATQWMPGVGTWNQPPEEGTRMAIVSHVGIADERTPKYLPGPGSVPLEHVVREADAMGAELVLAGDWHEHRVWRRTGASGRQITVMQVGALVPTGFDNPGMQGYGTVVTWDTETGKTAVHKLDGPRFVQTRDATLADVRRLRVGAPYTLHVQVVVPPGQVGAARAAADAWAAEREAEEYLKRPAGVNVYIGKVVESEVLVDAEEAQTMLRTAAAAATSGETLGEALEAFVRGMPLPADVDRAAVRARAERLIAQASGRAA
jgi:hypothetical protein